jgi:hypothetical protein
MRSVDEYRRCGQERSPGFVRTVLGLPKTFPGGPPRWDSGASVQGVVLSQGTACSTRAKIFVEQFRRSRSALGNSPTPSRALRPWRPEPYWYWVKGIGVARLDKFRD